MSENPGARASARRYDTSMRWLFRLGPRALLARLAWPTERPVQIMDSNRSRVIREVDNLFRVDDDPPWLALIEVQASHDPLIPHRLRAYSSLIALEHQLPIRRAVVLLSPAADGPGLTGYLEEPAAEREDVHAFGYRVTRLWRQPVDAFLQDDPALLPLAPLADSGTRDRREIVDTMISRIEQAAPSETRAELFTAAYFVMGLRYPEEDVDRVRRRLRAMRESWTYQAVLDEGREQGLSAGRVEEARALLLRVGARKFGLAADARIAQSIAQIDSLDRLEHLIDRVLASRSWPELLEQR